MSIAVLATLRVDDAHVEAMRAALLSLAAQAANEPGTELFEVHESTAKAGHFVVFERYLDEAAVSAHRTSPAMDGFRAALRQADSRPDLVFLTPLSSPGDH